MAAVLGYLVVLAAIVSATVAVCLGHVDAQTYSAIVGAALGGGIVHVTAVKGNLP